MNCFNRLGNENFFKFVESQPEKRDYVIRELVETEKNYVDVLTKLKKNFMIPLQQFLKPEVHSIVFCKITVRLQIFFFAVKFSIKTLL